MKKIRLTTDIKLIGYRTLRTGEEFYVEKFNTRYVYFRENNIQIKISKNECEKIY